MPQVVVKGLLSLVIGCGFTSQRDLCKSDQIVAIDIDKEKILQARKNDNLAHYLLCDAHFLPLRPVIAMDVVCTDVLEHFADYEKVLKNIVKLKPYFVYLRYPTEIRETLLTKSSSVYREQHWGKIHLSVVQTRRIMTIFGEAGYGVQVRLTAATTTFRRLFLQWLLEKLRIRYSIPDLGFVSFSENRKLYGFLTFICSELGSIGYFTYILWKYLKVTTVHDNYIVCATLG